MLIIFIVLIIVFSVIKFFCSETGFKFLNWLDEKSLERDLAKIDPLLVEERKARRKSIERLKKEPAILNAYAEYRGNLRRKEKPVPLDDFINAYLDSFAGIGNVKLNLDEDGEIISVILEGYGEVPLDLIKETEPRAYKQIMDTYEKFKRENNLGVRR